MIIWLKSSASYLDNLDDNGRRLKTEIGGILKPCGPLRGEGGFTKSPRKSTRGEGGLMVLSTWTKYIGFFSNFLMLQEVLIFSMVGKM